MFTRLQSPNVLLKVVAATRALKFDHVNIDVRHQSLSFARLNCRRLVLGRGRAACSLTPNDQSGIIRCGGVFSALREASAAERVVRHIRQIASFCCGKTVQQAAPNVHSRVAETQISLNLLVLSREFPGGLVMAHFDLRFIASEERSICEVKSDG